MQIDSNSKSVMEMEPKLKNNYEDTSCKWRQSERHMYASLI